MTRGRRGPARGPARAQPSGPGAGARGGRPRVRAEGAGRQAHVGGAGGGVDRPPRPVRGRPPLLARPAGDGPARVRGAGPGARGRLAGRRPLRHGPPGPRRARRRRHRGRGGRAGARRPGSSGDHRSAGAARPALRVARLAGDRPRPPRGLVHGGPLRRPQAVGCAAVVVRHRQLAARSARGEHAHLRRRPEHRRAASERELLVGLVQDGAGAWFSYGRQAQAAVDGGAGLVHLDPPLVREVGIISLGEPDGVAATFIDMPGPRPRRPCCPPATSCSLAPRGSRARR